MKLRILLLLLAATILPTGLEAATYTALASACGSDFVSNSGPVAAAFQDFNGGCSNVYGRSGAIASESGLGASAEMFHYCCATYGTFWGEAQIDTQFIITGPFGPEPLVVSLNLALHGGFGGGVGEDYNARAIRMDVNTPNALFMGEMIEVVNPPSGISYIQTGELAPGRTNCFIICEFTSPQFLITTNVVQNLTMRLSARVTSGTQNSYGEALAMDTFYFPLNGSVFNLPEGYTATIFGMNVEDNRVVRQGGGGGEVPEPATSALIGAGLLMCVARKRARGGL